MKPRARIQDDHIAQSVHLRKVAALKRRGLYGIETSLWFDLRRLHCLCKRGRHLIGVDDPGYACCLNGVGAGAGQGILYMPAV